MARQRLPCQIRPRKKSFPKQKSNLFQYFCRLPKQSTSATRNATTRNATTRNATTTRNITASTPVDEAATMPVEPVPSENSVDEDTYMTDASDIYPNEQTTASLESNTAGASRPDSGDGDMVISLNDESNTPVELESEVERKFCELNQKLSGS